MYRKFGKRLFDIIASLLALIILSPILLITAILVRVKLGKPIIFKQPRPGRHCKIFNLYKFRSMTNKTDENGQPLPDIQRLTSFGKTLRSTSLDELPSLINILKGDMSIVGPRPLLVEYLPYYTKEEARRHDVRPGITGLSQVNGRNLLAWDDRLAMDILYVDKISFFIDMKIILKTILKVVKRDGVVVRDANVMLDLNVEREMKNETNQEIAC